MSPFGIVPRHVFFNVHVCVIDTAELKSVNKLSPKDAVECVDVSILLRNGNVRELLLCFQVDQEIAHSASQELRSVVIANDYALQIVAEVRI